MGGDPASLALGLCILLASRADGFKLSSCPVRECPQEAFLCSLSLAGGSLAGDAPGDQELYVRWLQIVTFLPVMAFSTPPWLCCDTWVCIPLSCGGGGGYIHPLGDNLPPKATKIPMVETWG